MELLPKLGYLYLQIKFNAFPMRSLHINELKNAFSPGEIISIQDLIDFYNRFENKVKRSTIEWRVYKLKQEGILHRVSRGAYSLGGTGKSHFTPKISRSLKNLYGKIQKQFPFIDKCIWSTKWLNEFMVHQPSTYYTIIETEKDVTESLFYFLREAGRDVYLNPSEDILGKYVLEASNPIIIINLTTEAPTLQVGHVKTATLEKILVDIFCDEVLFAAHQGTELKNIYRNALEKYQVSNSKLLRYAGRRNKRDEINDLMDDISKKRQ